MQFSPGTQRMLELVLYPGVIVVALVFLIIRPIADFDCWFHMALGRYVMEHHAIPYTDVFSFTAGGREWISSGWLPSVMLHLLFQAWGPAGPVLMVLGVVGAAYLGIYYWSHRRYSTGGVMCLLLVASLLASYMRFNPRPDVWTLLMSALLSMILVSADERLEADASRMPRALWSLPILFLAWANLHAGFMAGYGIVAIFCAAQLLRWRQSGGRARLMLLVPCVVSLVTWVANPYGFRLPALAQKIKSIPGVRDLIFEWMPIVYLPGYNLPWPTYLGIALFLGLAVWVVRTSPQRVPRWRLVCIAFFVLFGFYQRRQMGPAAFVLPIMLAPHMGGLDLRMASVRMLKPALALAGGIALCVMQYTETLAYGGGMPIFGFEARMLPCFATDFLLAHRPPQNMFNTYGFGGYLLYFLGPETKVFMDGRLDIYPASVWEDYLAAEEDRLSLDETVRRYGIQTFVIDIRDSYGEPRHLAPRLTERPDWKLIYFDDDVGIYVHESPETASYIAPLELKYVTPHNPQRLVAALGKPETRDPALHELRRVLELSGGSANAHALTALAAATLGDRQSAASEMAQALARDPKCYLARQLAGRAQR
jgi:hypothetical protein